jgi:hypothetical protein
MLISFSINASIKDQRSCLDGEFPLLNSTTRIFISCWIVPKTALSPKKVQLCLPQLASMTLVCPVKANSTSFSKNPAAIRNIFSLTEANFPLTELVKRVNFEEFSFDDLMQLILYCYSYSRKRGEKSHDRESAKVQGASRERCFACSFKIII